MDRLRRYSQLNIEMEKHNGTNGRPSSYNPLRKIRPHLRSSEILQKPFQSCA